jgi:hypothetical protein
MKKNPKNSRTRPPAFQFYAMDWLTDPALRLCDPATRGVWIDLLCYMFLSSEPGFLIVNGNPLNEDTIRKFTGLDLKTFSKVFSELTDFGILRKDERDIYYSKRMVEDERLREFRRESGKLGGNPNLKKEVKEEVKEEVKYKVKRNRTPSSSSSSSSSLINKNINKGEDFEVLSHVFIETIRKELPNVSKLREQLSEEEANKLESEFGIDPVLEILRSMENYAKLPKTYVSVYLTASNWLKKRKNDLDNKNSGTSGRPGRPSFEDALRNF